ncbi:MAG: LamG domain-containing protein [Candidatus Woesearchaeota archaeon]
MNLKDEKFRYLLIIWFFLLTIPLSYSTNYISPDSVIRNSNIINSIINHSVIDSSNISNSNVFYSTIYNSNIDNLVVDFADIQNNLLIDGIIRYCGNTYLGPFYLSQIYACVAPSALGRIYFSKDPVKINDVVIVYYQNNINYDVNITIFFPSQIKATMRDDGIGCDSVANDGVYCYQFTVPSVSDGTYLIRVDVKDRQGNNFSVLKYLTVDSTAPIVTNLPTGKYNYYPIQLQFNTNEDSECRLSKLDLPIEQMPYVMSGLKNHTITFVLDEGTNVIYYKCKDLAGNIAQGTFTLYADYTKPILFQTLDAFTVYNTTVFGFYYYDLNPEYSFELLVDSSKFTNYKNSSLMLDFDGTTADKSFSSKIVNVLGSSSYVSGYAGSAFNFIGSNCVRINHHSVLNPNPYLGISFWFKTSQTNARIIDKKQTSSGFEISLNNGKIEALIQGSTSLTLQTNNSFNDNQWHHVLLLIDDSLKISTLVIDGSEFYTGSYSGSVVPNENLFIGCNDGSSNYYIGLIDELVIFNDYAFTFEQRAFNAYFTIDTRNFPDGLHVLKINVKDNYNNSNTVIFNREFNNYNEVLKILNLESNTVLSAKDYVLRFLVPRNTYYLTLSTNCGVLNNRIYDWTTTWQINVYQGTTQSNCYINVKAYDFENNLVNQITVSNITIDGYINFDFSLPSKVNRPFLINPIGDSDILYYDLYICNNYIDRFLGTYLAYPSSYGSCEVKLIGIDRVGNILEKTKTTFIDFKPPVVSRIENSAIELQLNQIFRGTVRFDIVASDDNIITNYIFCVDGNCSSLGNQNYIMIDTLQYSQGMHELYACAKDELNNTGCSKYYFVIFDNLIGNYSLFVYNLVNDSYLYGIKNYSVHLPQNTYNLKVYLNTTIPTKIFDGLSTILIINTTQFADGYYLMWLEARDNLGNLLANVSYKFYILNAVLPAPVLSVVDRYDKDGIINLTWNSISNAKKYAIYRAYENNVFTLLTYTTNNYFFDFVIDGVYRYYVVAIDNADKEGIPSNINITEVRRNPVVGILKISHDIVKPGDEVDIKYYAYDNRTLNIIANVFSNNYLVYYYNYTLEGYLYNTTVTIPSVNGVYELLTEIGDLFGHSVIDKQYLTVDNILPSANLNLITLSARGFKEYNQSVTALPFIYYEVSTQSNDECLVLEAYIVEEFSPVSLSFNNISYSGIIKGKPLVKDFILEGNFTKSISLSKGTIFSRFYVKKGKTFSLNLGINFNYDGNSLNFGSNSVNLDDGFHELIIQFNATNSIVYLDGYAYFMNGFSLSQILGTNVIIDSLVVSPSFLKDFSYRSCSGSLYLTTEDGNKTVIAIVRDVAGNINISKRIILLDKSGSKLDVTPPSEPVINVVKKWVNATDLIEFYWSESYDFEQSLLNLPLMYEFELYKNDILIDTGIVNSTNISFDYRSTYQNNDKYYLKVRAVNLANLKSNFTISDEVIVDVELPSLPLITSSSHQSCIWTNAKVFVANWSAIDLVSGIEDYSFALYVYNLSQYGFDFIYNFENKTSTSIPLTVDGELYFYVAARDKAKNIGPLQVYKICTDFTPPTKPQLFDVKQLEGTTILQVSFTKSLDYESKQVYKYQIQVLDNQNIIFDREYLVNELIDHGNYYSINITGIPEAQTYFVRVRAFDVANNPSLWSDNTFTEFDTTAPIFIYTTPSGEVINDQVKITVKTDEVAFCKYSLGGNYYDFLYTDSTYHETLVSLGISSGSVNIEVICTNKAGLYNSTIIVFTKSLLSTLSGASLSSRLLNSKIVSESLISFEVTVTRSGIGIANIPRSWFKIFINSSDANYEVLDFSIVDYGGGKYVITFKAPRYNSLEYTSNLFNVTIILTDEINELLTKDSIRVDELTGSFVLEGTNPLYKLSYNKTDNYAYGVGVDDSKVFAASLDKIEGDLSSGSFYLFLTTPDFDPKSIESYLYKNAIDEKSVTFGNLRPSESRVLNIFVPLKGKLSVGNVKLDSGNRRIKIIHKGYDELGNPVYDIEFIQ